MAVQGGNAAEAIRIIVSVDGDVLEQLRRITGQVKGFTRQTEGRMRAASRSFRLLGNAVKRTTGFVTGLANRYTALAGTLATSLVTAKAVRDAQRFGIAMAEVSTIFDDSEIPLAAVEQRILGVAEALGQNEAIAAKGFYQILSSDITQAAEATEVFEKSSRLATAGLADLKETANVVTAILKAYKLEVSETGRVTDILFETVRKGKTTIPELAISLGQVLPIAASLGVELPEVAAAIATITQGGIETNTAVIQLRQAFTQLLKPSVTAAGVLAEYNIDISQARIESTGFASVLLELKEKLGTNAKAYADIFGNIRALLPVLALADKQSAAFAKNLTTIGDAGGAVDDALDRLFDSPFKRVQVFLNAIRIRLRSVGSSFVKRLDELLGLGDEGGMEARLKTIATIFEGLRGAARQLAEVVSDTVAKLDALIERFDGLDARAIFRTFGTLVGAIIRQVISSVETLMLALLELIVNIPRLITSAINDIKRGLNQLSIGGVRVNIPVELTKDQLQEDIEALRVQFADEVKFLVSYGFDPNDLVDLQRGQAMVDELIAGAGGAGQLFGGGRDSLEGQTKALEFIREFDHRIQQLQIRQENASESTEDLSIRLSQVGDRLKDLVKPSGDVVKALDDLDSLMRRKPPGGSSFIGELAESVIRKAADNLAEVEAKMNDLGTLVPQFSEFELDQAALLAELENAEDLLRSIGIEVPVRPFIANIGEDPDLAALGGFQPFIEALRESLEEQFGVTIAQTLNSETLGVFLKQAAEFGQLRADLQRDINGGVETELRIMREQAPFRRLDLDLQLRQLGVHKDIRKEMQERLRLADKLAEFSLIGFTGTAQFAADLAGDVALPFKLQKQLIDDNIGGLYEMLDAAVEIGVVGEHEVSIYREIIEANRQRQIQELEILGIKEAQSRLNDPAFAAVSEVDRQRKILEDTVRETAREQANITQETVEGTQAMLDLRAAAEKVRLETFATSEAFKTGFLAALADIRTELADTFARGAQLAADLVGGLQTSIQQGLSLALQGDSDAFDKFRESLARSLADATSAAISEALTAQVIDILAPITSALGGLKKDAPLIAAASSLTFAADLQVIAANSLTAAAAALLASATGDAVSNILTTSFVDNPPRRGGGGFLSPGGEMAPPIQSFANGGVPQRIQRIAGGGIVRQRSLFEVGEAGQNELVVPLPGGRAVPVEMKGGGSLGSGRQTSINIAPTIHLNVTSDDRNFTQRILEQMPAINQAIAADLSQGVTSALGVSIQEVARGA